MKAFEPAPWLFILHAKQITMKHVAKGALLAILLILLVGFWSLIL